jgi:hypothetical protein
LLNLTTLKQLLSDPELRQQVSQLVADKIRADQKSLEVNAQLSRHLLDLSRSGGSAEDTARAVRLSVKEHLEFYQTLVQMTLSFNQRLSARLNDLSSPTQSPTQPVIMNIVAAVGGLARMGFQLENNRARPISVGFEITPFASEDGRQLVAADVIFDPPSLELRPGQEERIELILRVADPFRAGNTYFGTLTVTGLEATQLLVRLQVEERRTMHAAPGLQAQAEPVAPEVKARTAPRANATPNTKAKPKVKNSSKPTVTKRAAARVSSLRGPRQKTER